MALPETLKVGQSENDGTGDRRREAFVKIQRNMDYLEQTKGRQSFLRPDGTQVSKAQLTLDDIGAPSKEAVALASREDAEEGTAITGLMTPDLTRHLIAASIAGAAAGTIGGALATRVPLDPATGTASAERIVLTADGSTGPVGTMSVTATGTGNSRTLADRFGDAPSLLDFGAPVNGDWTAVVQAAEAAPNTPVIRLPAGRYPVRTGHYEQISKVYVGPGRLVVGANASGQGGLGAAPFRAFVTAPLPEVPDSRLEAFSANDWSKALPNGVAYTFIGSGATGAPTTTYKNFPQLSQSFRIFDYTAGFNADPGDHAKGRSGGFVDIKRIYHGGQGDLVGDNFFGEVYSTRPGATHWLANPALVVHNGNISATGLANGAYLNESEYIYSDSGLSVAVVDRVRNYVRTNNTKTVDQVWVHDRPQSSGTKPIDVFYAPQGKGRAVFDATGVESADGAAVIMKAGQRIYYNATPATDSSGANFGAGALGDVWTIYDPATKTLRVNVGAGGSLVVDNLPSSATGLPSGALYKDANGFLKVAP